MHINPKRRVPVEEISPGDTFDALSGVGTIFHVEDTASHPKKTFENPEQFSFLLWHCAEQGTIGIAACLDGTPEYWFIREYGVVDEGSFTKKVASHITRKWNFPGHAGQQLQMRRAAHEYGGKAFSFASAIVKPGVDAVRKAMDPMDLKIQQKAFAHFGHVESAEYNRERLRQSLTKILTNEELEYAPKDYTRLRGFRVMTRLVNRQYWGPEIKEYRKVLSRIPGRVNTADAGAALRQLDRIELGGLPTRRITWIALANGGNALAQALMNASDYELRKAKAIYFDYKEEMTGTREQWYTGRSNRARYFVNFLDDARGACTAQTTLPGWVKRAIRWHREADERARQRRIEAAKRHKELLEKTVEEVDLSVVADPDRFTQLRTWDQVREEGSKMDHCVASYAREAMEKKVLIFHYEDDHGEATIMLGEDYNGTPRVLQCYGPKNNETRASRNAEKAIKPLLKRESLWMTKDDVINEIAGSVRAELNI